MARGISTRTRTHLRGEGFLLTSASISEHTGQKVIRQTQCSREDVDCDEDNVG